MGMETSSLFFLPGTSLQTFLKQADIVNMRIIPCCLQLFSALGLGTAVPGAEALPVNVAVSAAGKLVVSQEAGCNRASRSAPAPVKP